MNVHPVPSPLSRLGAGLLFAALLATQENAMSTGPVDVIHAANNSIHRFVLENGLTVLLREEHNVPLVAIQYWVGAGSIHEEAHLGGGLSHYLEHMVFKGTDTREPGQISAEIADAGGEINAYTSNDRTVYHIVMPSERRLDGLDILTDAVFHPSFPEEEWAREREVILREVDMGEDDPSRVMGKLSWETAFLVHPYRVPIIGWRDILTTMTRNDLVAYHRRHYSPANMILTMAGDFSATEMEATIRERLAAISRTVYEPVFIPAEPPQLAERHGRQTGPYEITRITWSFHTVALSDPDTAALDVLAAVVGSGRSSLLVRRLREERQLVLDVDAWSYTPQYPGLFSLYAECEPEREAAVTDAFREEVLRWQSEPFDSTQLDRARREVLVQSIRQLATVEGLASSMASGEFYAANPRHIETYLDLVNRVTPEDLTRVARKYLQPANGSWAILAPDSVESAEGAEAEPEEVRIQPLELSNGLRVLVLENSRLPMAYVSAVVGGGLLSEVEGQAGISQLASELLTRGTSAHTAAELAEQLEARGIELSTFAGRNSYGLSVSGLSEDLPLMLETAAECLLDAQFPEEEVEKQRALQLAAIRRELERPMSHANQLMRNAFFPGHPYRYSLHGTAETVERISRDDLLHHHRSLLTASNLVLAVFGDLTADDVAARLETLFASLPANPLPEWPPLPAPPTRSIREEIRLPFKQTVLIRAWPGIAVGDPRDDALSIVMDALSGLSSDLFIEVRDKRGLAYYTGATHFSGPVGGLFLIYAGTTDDGLTEVESQIQLQVDRLSAEGLRQEEFQRAVEQILVETARSWQNLGTLAQQCALDELFGIGYQHSLDTAERLKHLTPEAVGKAAASIFSAASVTSIVLSAPADATATEDEPPTP
ncbi:MAG: insulinase family protein [Verrucomicrobiota bacterium]|jgi:zinc protease|nr:insulinase family protein [Verrucomicrobiota bacterium]